MQLRKHQYLGYKMCQESVRQGKNRPVLAAGCSYGKTIVAGHMLKSAQDKGKTAYFLCDRIQLVEQAIEAFTEMGIKFGVKQADHPLTDPTQTVQIVSIQTLAAIVGKHGRNLPAFDFAIVDEAHTSYTIIDKIIESYNNIPIIALTATPYAKGLGKKYNNLLVPITQRELLEQGYLAPIKYYGGEHIDMSKIRSVDPNTYKIEDIERETDKDDRLAGCIIRNWMEYGENSQTIAFSPTQNLSKNLVEMLNKNGISAEHVDCSFSQEDRQALFEAHDRGEFKVLSCSRLLNTGYDAPSVRCMIDCFPVKSVTTYVQRAGRLSRIHPGKEYAIYLDHASNFDRFGYYEDIVPESLHDGESTHNEKSQIKKEAREVKTRECPDCLQQMSGYKCKACGYEVPRLEQIEDDGAMLVELTGSKANRKDSKEVKEQFLSELHYYAKTKGYKVGWAANQYRSKYSVWPNKISFHDTDKISDMTKGWLQHQRIAYANRKTA